MYISGSVGDCEKRMHQLATSYGDLQTGFIPECRSYFITIPSTVTGLSGTWAKEITKIQCEISGSGDGRNVL